MITCVNHSQTETFKGTGSPCHYIFYLVEDGPFCRHRIRAKRVIFDNLFHFNFIKIRCNFFGITLISDGVLSWVSCLNLFMENIDVSVCASLPWGLATWRESVEADCQSAFTRPHALSIALRSITLCNFDHIYMLLNTYLDMYMSIMQLWSYICYLTHIWTCICNFEHIYVT